MLSQNSLVLGLPSSEMTHRVQVVTKSFPARVTARLLIWRTEKEKSSIIVRRETNTGFEIRQSWDRVPASVLTGSVTSVKIFNLQES